MVRKVNTGSTKPDTSKDKNKNQKHKSTAGPKASDELEKLKSQLEAAENKLKESQDKYLRLSAEFDNYRKRTLREKSELLKSGGEDTIIKVLPVLDDFERAMLAMQTSKDIEAVKDGIVLIYNKLKETLTQQGIKEIEALNLDFNTDLHEAITKIPAPNKELQGKVVDVVQKGYYLNDKVLRFAKVVIGE
ncbi:MAG: nucleotide exchange factor GrpE [Bacteroidales bacterium]|nr:nucleotide exchange factor GrpE [Bacteroidales bacterium]MCB8999718.1 nucleotide exchange factor GrpE [Bacteroidales bacterium]MCB9013122.1 nucleotide exchange factor GrpE [Bacteroidales bacterium]